MTFQLYESQYLEEFPPLPGTVFDIARTTPAQCYAKLAERARRAEQAEQAKLVERAPILPLGHPNKWREILPVPIMQHVFVVGKLRKGDQKAVRCVSKIYSGLLSRKYSIPRLILITRNREKFGTCITCGLRIRCQRKINGKVCVKQDANMAAIQCICGCWAHKGCIENRSVPRNRTGYHVTPLFPGRTLRVGLPEHCSACPYYEMILSAIMNGNSKWFIELNKKYIGLP